MRDKDGNRIMQRISFDGRRIEDFVVTPERMYKYSRRPWDFQCKTCPEYGNGRSCYSGGEGGCDDKNGGRDRWYEI